MAEIITLTSPIVPPTQSTIRFERIIIDVEAKSVMVQWLGNNSEPGSAVYPTPAVLNPLGALQPSGQQLIQTLNTANLTSNSLVRRTLTRLQTDGYIPAGTLSGTPD